MEDYRILSRLMERTLHKYIQLEKKARVYGDGITLTQAELHTISIVGDLEDINVTKLASMRGITKGAASQMIYKLVDKTLIEKRVSPNSDTEVCLSLTPLGKIIYEEHKEYHRKSESKFLQLLKNMSKEEEEHFIHIFQEFEKMLDEKLQ